MSLTSSGLSPVTRWPSSWNSALIVFPAAIRSTSRAISPERALSSRVMTVIDARSQFGSTRASIDPSCQRGSFTVT